MLVQVHESKRDIDVVPGASTLASEIARDFAAALHRVWDMATTNKQA